MHVVIMGCGRVGSALAERLDAEGHSVAIIDQDPEAFRKLHSVFSGEQITGVGFDRETLIRANIEKADGFAAVSSGDNSNIISARVARESFKVPRVVARIYDPRRAEIYSRLGIQTVASVRWTTEQIIQRLQPIAKEEFRDSTGTLTLEEMQFNPLWIGQRSKRLALHSGARIGYINRYGKAILPDDETVLQEGDIVHAFFRLEDKQSVTDKFMEAPNHAD